MGPALEPGPVSSRGRFRRASSGGGRMGAAADRPRRFGGTLRGGARHPLPRRLCRLRVVRTTHRVAGRRVCPHGDHRARRLRHHPPQPVSHHWHPVNHRRLPDALACARLHPAHARGGGLPHHAAWNCPGALCGEAAELPGAPVRGPRRAGSGRPRLGVRGDTRRVVRVPLLHLPVVGNGPHRIRGGRPPPPIGARQRHGEPVLDRVVRHRRRLGARLDTAPGRQLAGALYARSGIARRCGRLSAGPASLGAGGPDQRHGQAGDRTLGAVRGAADRRRRASVRRLRPIDRLAGHRSRLARDRAPSRPPSHRPVVVPR